MNAIKLAMARKMLAGYKVGDRVKVSWKVDPAYGGGERSHTGIIERLDDMLYLQGTDHAPGHLRIHIVGLTHVTNKIEKVERPDVISEDGYIKLDVLATNPMMEKLRARDV